MDFYYDASALTKPNYPDEDVKAEPCAPIGVKNVTVVIAREGGLSYRGAIFGGVFVIPEDQTEPNAYRGKPSLPVFCLWFGQKLNNQIPHFTILRDDFIVMKDYTGPVFTDIRSVANT